MKKLNLALLLAALSFSVLLSSCKKNDDDDGGGLIEKVQIGGMLSLTGNWSTLGITSKAAMAIAIEDVNAYMAETGSRFRFTDTIFDTKLDTGLAVAAINLAKARGINLIIGPQSSAEVAAIKSFANSKNMLVVSQGSTAGSLSIANDNIFRFCPNDKIEGAAMGHTIYKAGIRGLVTVARDDAGNKGLQTSTGASFTAQGGTIAAIAPYSTTTTDFTSVIADIKSHIQSMQVTFGTTGAAVYLASFDECVDLFKQAAGDPVLSSVNWYGADGVALSEAIKNDHDAAAFAVTTHFFAPNFGLPDQAHSKWETLAAKIKLETGIEPDAFALASYDAVWVLALAYNASSTYSFEFTRMKKLFVEQANSYYGTTGPTLLDDAGDRAVGTYDYLGLAPDGTGYKWVLVGKSE